MGQPVVHFEVVGKDGDKLQSYYAELFGWNINSDNPMNYGMVDGKDNKTPTATGHRRRRRPGPRGLRRPRHLLRRRA